jgi:hypothetical protein
MMAIALHRVEREPGIVALLLRGAMRWRALIIAFALGFPLLFYLVLLGMLVAVYGHLPNYLAPYNWVGNVLHIIASTPAVADMLPIIRDEWLIETGYINYDYGNGIADWSLSVIPHKFLIVSLAGALIGLNAGLLLDRLSMGTFAQQSFQLCQFGLLTGIGALCTSVTNATVFSVVHCATPSWVGSLAVLGFDTFDVFAVEPYGPLIGAVGFAALILSALLIVRDERPSHGAVSMPARGEVAPC